jgi:hypothetical protein
MESLIRLSSVILSLGTMLRLCLGEGEQEGGEGFIYTILILCT